MQGILAQNSSVYDPTNHSMFQLSSDSELAFSLEGVLSLADNGGANTGEILRIAAQFVPGSEESTYTAYMNLADPIHDLAESIDPEVDPAGARENYFHAATYYRGAAFFLTGNQSDPRLVTLWDKQIADFNKAISLLRPVPGEPFTVSAKNSSIGPYKIPGYFYKAHSDPRKKVPTILAVSGYDGSHQESFHTLCVQVLLRGMNCVTYEGPGQPTPRRYQNIGFIPDWWTATSPVVDYLFEREDVDTSKIVLLGESFGGTLAPRGASKEPRISAVIALDGLSSFQSQLLDGVGTEIAALYNSNKTEEFNEIMNSIATNTSYPLSSRWFIQQGLYAFDTTSPFDWVTQLGKISVTNDTVTGMGKRPILILKGQVCVILDPFTMLAQLLT